MKRVVVIHKCGAIGELLSPEGDEAALERRRREEEARDCPYCEAERVFIQQADEHFPVGAEQGAPRLRRGEEP